MPRELKFFQQGEVSKEKKQPTKRKVPASGKKEKSGKVKKEAMDYIDLDTLARVLKLKFRIFFQTKVGIFI